MNHQIKKTHWPLFIMALAAAFTGVTVWSIHRASSAGSPIADRDYYRHGLHYGQAARMEERAAQLGWLVDLTRSGDILAVQLTDATGGPVSGCQGRLLGGHFAAEGKGKAELPLNEISPGLYEARLPSVPVGGLALTLVIVRDDASLTRRLFVAGS